MKIGSFFLFDSYNELVINMKKLILLFLLLFQLNGCNNKEEIKVNQIIATSYIVLQQSNNKILEGNNYDISRSVASISKIMTAIIVIENSDVNEIVKVPEEIKYVDGSSIYLKIGQEISRIDLLYGLLLRSGNDAAVTLALSVCKRLSDFVDLMNQKASDLKMNHSYFNNPHGLDVDDGGNISSAYDMAILYSYCLDNELFAKIVNTKSYKNFENKNKLLKSYEYCTGGKTGYTLKAKRTLISSASKDNINLIIVTLNCGNDFESHKNKYEYYFNNYTAIQILNKGENSFDNHVFYCKKDYYFITNQNNLNLLYYLNESNKTIQITLYDQNHHVIDVITIIITMK